MRTALQLLLALTAFAGGGCVHGQTGPLVGYSPTQGVMLGWEGGAGASLLSISAGAEVRPAGDHVLKIYGAGEPALSVPLHSGPLDRYEHAYLSFGPTAGGALDEHARGVAMVGGWAGVPWIRSGECRTGWAYTASISIGVHVFLDGDKEEWMFYATPKIGALRDCPDFRDTFPLLHVPMQ